MSLNTNRNAAIVALDAISRKQNQYENDIKKIATNLNVFADIISISGTVEQSLLNNDDENDDVEKMVSFMNEQRAKLKEITERNIQTQRFVCAYMNAANSIRRDIGQNVATTAENESGEEKEASAIDYETILQTKIELEKHAVARNSIAIKDESMMRNVRQNLKEKDMSNNNDDEIEVEGTQGNVENELKCPFTGMIFEDPVKSKVCHHVYSKQGIQNHLRVRKYHCPIVGCRNSKITMQQLEPDEEMKIRVRRYRKTMQEKQRYNAMSQDYDVEDEDEEEEEEINGVGMTVIE